MRTLSTYSVPGVALGMNVPLPMQSSYMRLYAEKHDYIFCLPVVEIFNSPRKLMLGHLLHGLGAHEHVCTSTVLFLPLKSFSELAYIGEITIRKRLTWHFLLEGQMLVGADAVAYLSVISNYYPRDLSES